MKKMIQIQVAKKSHLVYLSYS